MVNSQRVFTLAYHPQSNMVERAHKTLKQSLRALCTHPDIQKKWDRMLPIAVSAYNKAVHASTGETPYYLMHGRDPISLFELSIGQLKSVPANMDQYIRDLAQQVAIGHQFAKDTLTDVRTSRIVRANARRQSTGPQPGELQWLWVPSLKQAASKLASKWYGTYRVTRRPTAYTAVLQGQGGRFIPRSVHIDRLKPYIDPSNKPYEELSNIPHVGAEDQESWQSVDPDKHPPLFKPPESAGSKISERQPVP